MSCVKGSSLGDSGISLSGSALCYGLADSRMSGLESCILNDTSSLNSVGRTILDKCLNSNSFSFLTTLTDTCRLSSLSVAGLRSACSCHFRKYDRLERIGCSEC